MVCANFFSIFNLMFFFCKPSTCTPDAVTEPPNDKYQSIIRHGENKQKLSWPVIKMYHVNRPNKGNFFSLICYFKVVDISERRYRCGIPQEALTVFAKILQRVQNQNSSISKELNFFSKVVMSMAF